jgi:hypothetical protein
VSVTAPSRTGARPARPAAARPRRAPARALPAPRRLTAGGLAWVLVLAALLGGIVALNVAALRASIRVSGLAAHARSMQQANRTLNAKVAWLTVPDRIDAKAKAYGMVQLSPTRHSYLSFTGHRQHDHRARAFAR